MPRFWGEAEWAAYLVPNHPVVGVSYFEAEAYAAFIGGRLPTEAEWEKAARGVDARKYPWGSDWIDDACGMRGVGPRSTVPVGVFPKGASPYGVRDMVGSIWQWCTDPFRGWRAEGGASSDDGADRDEGAVAKRTTCGGAWNTLQWSVSCTSRNGYPPSARFSNLGFRCVVGPSSSRRA
jgi:formylglycine-generating enzyme required for sulfatase activity